MQPSERDKLVKQRGIIKGSLTRIGNFIHTFKHGSDINKLRARMKQLPSLWEEYSAVQGKLELNDDESNSEAHEKDREQFEENYYDIEAKGTTLIETGVNTSKNSSNLSQQSHCSPAEVRLPIINLPVFHGQYQSWIHFRDTFQGLIVNNDRLSNIQRFHYLLSALKEEPHQLIQNLPISNDNFMVAWNTICKRYNNKKLIATQHIKALLSLPTCHKATSTDLRQLNNQLTNNLNAIQCLKLEVPLHEIILQQLVLDRLDAVTRKEFETQTSSDVFPKLSEVSTFLEERAQVLELMAAARDQRGTSLNAPKSSQSKVSSKPPQLNYVATKDQCKFCGSNHPLHRCGAFLKSTTGQRYEFVKNKGLCFNCFRQHGVRSCKSGNCKLCNRKHHTLLHFDAAPRVMNDVSLSSNDDNHDQHNLNYCALKLKPHSQVMLSTAMVQVIDSDGRFRQCRALLDNGSQSHFITDRLVKALRLKRRNNAIPINGINNTAVTTSQSVDVCIRSNTSNFQVTITCSILPQITGNIPASHIDCRSWKLPTDIQLADPNFNKPGPIDILIGAETFMCLLIDGFRKNNDNLPVLKNTKLGWVISGPIRTKHPQYRGPATQSTFLVRKDCELNVKMERFWSLEEVPSAKLLTREEQYCETHFKIHTKRDRSGRFIVRLPIRLDSPQLGLSYKIALKRFSHIERRLCSNPQLRAEYVSIMEEYQKLGHMRLVSDNPKDNDGFYYMPHHPVFKEQSTTTKVRVVFDASCKSDNGISLNDILAVGPTVQQDLLALITRFRTHQVALTADVAKMYRQIRVDDEDINLQRILWRESPLEPVRVYQLTTVTHGISSASFLATRCLIQLAEEEAHEFPRASQILKRDFYVDDALFGTDTVEEAIELRQELQTLLARGGFSLRKWSSNHTAVLETIPAEFRETRCSLRFDEKDSIKTLGLSWNPTTDEFLFEIHVKEYTGPPTKRKVLSIISSIFDPLGLLGPVVVLLKMFMQQMWQANLGWDDTLPFPMLQTWQALYKDLPELNNVRTHRLIFGRRKMSEIQIHGFSDASEKAYAACVYARCVTEDGECSVRLVCSKSRVAPLKQQSIPRLELCGALLLARLVAKTMQTLELKIDSIFLWVDSTIVLAWIRAEPTKWKTFVANRVAEIQELTVGASWNHVPSEGNPADKLSRGESAASLRDDKQWWQGPSWLKQEQAYWPSVIPICATDKLPEQRTKMQCFANTIHQEDIINRFSSLHRLQRVIAYCNRFVSNARRKSKKITGSLSSEELATALDICIRKAQHLTYASEISALKISSDVSSKSPIKSLNPFLDGNGILRVGGRLHNCLKPFAERHQIILPPRHHLTELIITSEHVRLLHAGCQHLIASLRRKYWIVNIRRIARPIIHKCMPCFRLKATTATQLMGQLPTPRVTPSRPFLNTGVDYAGPLYIKQSGTRSKIKVKCYVALFICLSTKAVHLELVRDLTSQAFIAALRRFTARRGKCASIYSDNATNFVGAKNELEELRNMLKSKDTRAEIEDHAANEGFRWYFMPPNAPHFGGLWEAGVKSMKHHLRRTAGNASLTYDEMHTLLCQIEACLNSRPLIRLSDDPDDFAYLSPGHFLIGAPLTAIPEPDWSVDAHSHASRWRFIQSLQQGFWKQWSSDYLNSLQQRSKWRDSRPNLTPGMVVIVREDNLPPLSWKLAVIKEVIPGKDGRVRTAVIRTSSGNLKRSIHKLCPLPSQ